jgi:hypothetical protein
MAVRVIGCERLLVAAISIAALLWAAPAPAMQLVSIKTPGLKSDSFISGFKIETWDIYIRAICKIPVGWIITAGKDISLLGKIDGSASGFMTNLNFRQVVESHELDDLFLIDDPEPHARPRTEPPPFVGSITLGDYSKLPRRELKVRLSDSDIVLRPAAECPVPTPR